MQGKLSPSRKTFGSFEEYDMCEANDGLENWIKSPQPFLLVCIIEKTKRIGEK